MDNINKMIIYKFYLQNKRLTTFNGCSIEQLPDDLIVIKKDFQYDEQFIFYLEKTQFILTWIYIEGQYNFAYPLDQLYKHTR